MDHTRIMSLDHILRENISPADILGNLRCQVIPHGAVDDRILVRILLLGQFIIMAQKREDLRIRTVLFTQKLMSEPVVAVMSGKPVDLSPFQFIDHHVLDFFDTYTASKCLTPELNVSNDEINLCIS